MIIISLSTASLYHREERSDEIATLLAVTRNNNTININGFFYCFSPTLRTTVVDFPNLDVAVIVIVLTPGSKET